MTGFANLSRNTNLAEIVVEARSVNSRYLDINLKVPSNLRELEPRLREIISKRLSRGKIDYIVSLKMDRHLENKIWVDEKRLQQIIDACNLISNKVACSKYEATRLLTFPGVLCEAPLSIPCELETSIIETFKDCTDKLVENRRVEGEKLAVLIHERLGNVDAICKKIGSLLKISQNNQKEKVLSKINALDINPDPNRVAQELVLLLLKSDIDEEIDRLVSHSIEIKRILSLNEPCGRKLDFLMQELNRETNTIASKSISKDISFQTVELKVLIEQMREQVQNIE